MTQSREWTIDVLGPLTLTRNGVPVDLPSNLQAAVLICLAVAGEKGLTPHELRDSIGGPGTGSQSIGSLNALQRHISDLRTKTGLGEALPRLGEHRSNRYALDFSRVCVDAERFITGVRALTEPPSPEEATELLSLWRQNPRVAHPHISRHRWSALFRARDTLLNRLQAAAEVPRLTEFFDLFPDESTLEPLRSRLTARERRRLLVVDDINLEVMIGALSDYDCVPVRDFADWMRLLRTDLDSILSVHGALIDLHLAPEFRDNQGLIIAEWLRDNTDIPVALVTMAPPAAEDLTRELRAQQDEYRLVTIVHKGYQGIDLAKIRKAAEALTSEEDKYVRRRLERWVDSALWKAKDRLLGSPNDENKKKLKELRTRGQELRMRIQKDPAEVWGDLAVFVRDCRGG
jgi:hypothetical protein